MSIRAYKIAEELGIERGDFVERAKEVGIELKSAMTAVDAAQAAALRRKLGEKKRERVVEARIKSGGGAVIRRRKRVAEAAAPAPEPEAKEAPESESESEATSETPPSEKTAAPEKAPVAAAPKSLPAPAAERSAARQRAASTREEGFTPSRKQFKEVVNLREQDQLARSLTGRSGARGLHRAQVVDPGSARSPRKQRRDAPVAKRAKPTAKPEKKRIRVEGEISVAEFAKQLGAKAADVQGKLMALGTMVAVNQTIDFETAEQIALEFGFEVQNTGFHEATLLEDAGGQSEAKPAPRPAVVTVMGHVDHGKTSLLDALRESNVAGSEAGGITQHIGAYQLKVSGHTITFIDTPGHAAFTAMRARGAQVTDIVVLVVAATEGIMPQTVEAIEHARAAGVPIVVAVNKCDLPDADPQSTRQRLMEHSVVVEDFGGEVLAVDISATKRTGLDKLLEALVLQSEVLEPKSRPTLRARGAVLEAELDRGRGAVATVLIQEGTLRRGDTVVCGAAWGRVRSMSNERGELLEAATPSTPVQLIGLPVAPEAGELLHVVPSERAAKEIASHRRSQARSRAKAPARPRISLDELFAQVAREGPKQLNVIIKADAQGSAEALRDALFKFDTERVTLSVLATGVGGITESDVQLAEASGAVIVGFHVRPDVKARRAAEYAGVEIRHYQIIYEALDDVREAMAGLLPPQRKEVVLGNAEVRQTFSIPRVGTIAGCYVVEGLIRRGVGCRLLRDGVQVFEGRFASLKRFKDDAREVKEGFECGIGIENFNDLKVGDTIEAYEVEETPAEL